MRWLVALLLVAGCAEATSRSGPDEPLRRVDPPYTAEELDDARQALDERPCTTTGEWANCGLIVATMKGDTSCGDSYNVSWIVAVVRNDGSVVTLGDDYDAPGFEAMTALYPTGSRVRWTGRDCIVDDDELQVVR